MSPLTVRPIASPSKGPLPGSGLNGTPRKTSGWDSKTVGTDRDSAFRPFRPLSTQESDRPIGVSSAEYIPRHSEEPFVATLDGVIRGVVSKPLLERAA
jgi:hypothetical protein